MPKKSCLSCIIGLLFFLGSCTQAVKDDHPEYYGKFTNRLHTIYSAKNRVKIVDSFELAMRRFPVGTGDKAIFYRYKQSNYFEEGDYEKVFLYLDSIQWLIADRIDEERFAEMYIQGLITRSDCYLAMKNYDAGMKYLVQAKLLAENKIKSKSNVWVYTERMAYVLYRQRRYKLAASYFKKTYDEVQQATSIDPDAKFAGSQNNLDNVGLAYIEAGMVDSALFYCQAALDYINQQEKKFPQYTAYIGLAKAVAYGNMAKIRHQQKLYPEAERLSLASIQGTQKDYRDFTIDTKIELAGIYMEWGFLEKAKQILNELDSAFNFRSPTAMEEKRMAWNLSMKNLWTTKGDTTKALLYNNQYLSIRDSLETIEKNYTVADMGKEFENREQKAVNEILEKENKAKSFQLIIALLLSALAIITILFVWYSLRRKARHVKLLQHLNREVQLKNNDLREAFASLEQSQAENTRLTRTVAHDLKNPIGGIRNLMRALLKKEQPVELKEVLEIVQTACSNSITLINDLIKEKTPYDETKKEQVDIHRVLKYCVDLLQTKADEKSQRLYLYGDHVMIPMNREKMWRVISNILNNAIKFSPENTTINVKLEKTGDTVLLSVKDQGIGIPHDLKDKIFTLQPEASRPGTAGEESHGLGLSISRKIVEEHKGKIWFESEEGDGCTFYVELPGNN